MLCAACGTENRADRKFCAQCGAALALVCSACGAANLPGERFCGECGHSLAGHANPPPVADVGQASLISTGAPTAPGSSERRLVSVLFADLVGSTAMAEARDPEAVREVLGAYFVTARAVIERYGGTVEKFIGDAVMAVWGAPTAHEDDAERAVRAGLDLVDAVAGLRGPTGAPDLAARAAVLTGEAAVTVGAQGQGLVAGDLVNSAARLQGVAAPGTVLVGETTEGATRDAIVFEPAGEHAVKGKAMPIAAWRAMRVVAGRRGVGRADRLEAPFVGRATELRALKDALAATGSERRARYVAITGQAGIGKSRLAWELEKHIDGLVEPVYWHRGRSPAYGEGIGYWALGEMVRSRVGLLETDPPGAATAKLALAIETYVADVEDRRWIEPHLRVLLGLEGPTGGDRSEQFGAWRRFFEAISTRGSTVLAFEDLQWADDGLLDFIDSLFEWSRSHPILVIVLARPELLERRPGLGAASRNAITLHLEPLEPAALRELLAGFAPELEPVLVDAVVARSEGIPLYAIELVRMLRNGGAEAPPMSADRLAIPPSLQALVAARLDSLPSADRSLLQDAAVLGQSFTIPALAAVSGEDAAALEGRLRVLVRREFLSLEADPRSPERGQYSFVQSVVHEVAYGTLARRDRRSRHLAAARYVDSLGDESMATVVAAHYLEAYRAAPDDEQGRVIGAQARVALRGAAERSARLHNYEQAVRDLERALELTDDPTERAALLIQQAEWDEAGARYPEAAETAERARTAYAALGDDRAARLASAVLGRIEMKRGHWDEAAALLERSLSDLDASVDPATYARFAAEFARTRMIRNLVEEGADWAERALAAAGPGRAVEVIAEALNTRGVCLQYLGRLDEGIALIRASVELAAAHHLSASELRARFNLGGRLFADDPGEAIDVLRTGTEVARRTGRRDWLLALSGFLSSSLVYMLEYDEALDVMAAVPDEDRPTEDLANAVVTRAHIRACRGDPTAWTTGLAQARALVADQSNTQTQWSWAVSATWVAIAEGRLDDALHESLGIGGNWAPWRAVAETRVALRRHDLGVARAALASPVLQAELGAEFDILRSGLSAGVSALAGQRDEAVGRYAETARTARQISHPGTLADLLLDAVFVLGADDPETRAFADEARQVYERAGARACLDRLDEALRRSPHAPRTAAPSGDAVRTVHGG